MRSISPHLFPSHPISALRAYSSTRHGTTCANVSSCAMSPPGLLLVRQEELAFAIALCGPSRERDIRKCLRMTLEGSAAIALCLYGGIWPYTELVELPPFQWGRPYGAAVHMTYHEFVIAVGEARMARVVSLHAIGRIAEPLKKPVGRGPDMLPRHQWSNFGWFYIDLLCVRHSAVFLCCRLLRIIRGARRTAGSLLVTSPKMLHPF